jgi:UDP:flavonoid glycosyltransferase YjiC (YdhE family)
MHVGDARLIPSLAAADALAGQRVLVIAEAVTLAHVGRAVELAKILHAHAAKVVLACDSRSASFLRDLPFEVVSVQSIPAAAFLKALARGTPVYGEADLLHYAEDDLALIGTHRPAVVVGDFRLSLSASARHAGVPYVNVTNAYWSLHARPDFEVPSIAATRWVGLALTRASFRMLRPLAFAAHAVPLNRVRRRYGLAPLARDVRAAYTDGDLVLYADIPEMVPLDRPPSHHRFIGPVLWSPPVDMPAWWEAALAGVPPIYVTMGSSGDATRLPDVVEALMPLGKPIVVATAGRGAALPTRPGVWSAPFLPGAAIAARACAVVCNGGSPTTQQALVHGVPVVGIASNLDQFLNMHYVERFGAGVRLRADSAKPAAIGDAVQSVLQDAAVRTAAKTAASLATKAQPADTLPAAIAALVRRG